MAGFMASLRRGRLSVAGRESNLESDGFICSLAGRIQLVRRLALTLTLFSTGTMQLIELNFDRMNRIYRM
jgi:hypothetical protein